MDQTKEEYIKKRETLNGFLKLLDNKREKILTGQHPDEIKIREEIEGVKSAQNNAY